jgi:hypothetical protein
LLTLLPAQRRSGGPRAAGGRSAADQLGGASAGGGRPRARLCLPGTGEGSIAGMAPRGEAGGGKPARGSAGGGVEERRDPFWGSAGGGVEMRIDDARIEQSDRG